MGRELRMVPADWEHPRNDAGRHIPLLDRSYSEDLVRWRDVELPEWLAGQRLWEDEYKIVAYDGSVRSVYDMMVDRHLDCQYIPDNPTYKWWAGDKPEAPKPSDYMPAWTEDQCTHYMMYEDTSEGTPISPAFSTAEELAWWLAATGASAFGAMTASYEEWLATIKHGSSVSLVITDGQLVSGVSFMENKHGRDSV